jgi:hypothetical protein
MSSQAIMQSPQTYLAERFTAHDFETLLSCLCGPLAMSLRSISRGSTHFRRIQPDGPTGSVALVVATSWRQE